MRIDVWSDIACPWCYIGKRRLEAALKEFPHPAELTWHSFQLDPSAPASHEGDHASMLADKLGRSRAEAQHMLDDMTALAAADGLEYRFDIARSANTFDAHRLLHLALDRDRQDELKERLFAATFTQGRLISDHAVLTELAVEAGLDAGEVEAVLAGDKYGEQVRADQSQAAQLGITGVPFFVIDRKYGVSGAQPSATLRQVLTRAWEESDRAL